ncbi:MAG: PEP-CTERM sorting domain-containing protein [Burkholderiaceae bacterium]
MKSKMNGALLSATLILAAAGGGAHAQSVAGQGTWESSLQARDLDGNAANGAEAYYDTALGITWLKNAQSGIGSVYDSDGSGTMSWYDATAFAASVTLGGVAGWRLPTLRPANGTSWNYDDSTYWTGEGDKGFNITRSSDELAHMYHVTLGNLSFYDTSNNEQAHYGVTNMGYFENISSEHPYWFDTTYDALGPGRTWTFFAGQGAQGQAAQTRLDSVWLVHDGDVGVAISPVPEPASAGLMLAGLAGIGAVLRRRRA